MKTSTQTTIGLNEEKTMKMSDRLNVLLASYSVHYQNLRGFHWNISGPSFFELHAKFEEMYTAANMTIDEIAERILTLDQKPLHSFEDFLKSSIVKPSKNLSSAEETVKATIDDLSMLLPIEREILELSADIDDEGTNALMSDYIREQEKLVWMLKAYLG